MLDDGLEIGVWLYFPDDERLFGTQSSSLMDDVGENGAGSALYQQWEEFAIIATNLLEKIESFSEGVQRTSLSPSLPMNQLNISSDKSRLNPWEEIKQN